MLKNKNKNAFTLVELIIVITILAILATIAFISFQWYTWNARNSNRLSNVTNIKKTLELYTIKTQEYPLPDSYKQITWSWATAWVQWVIWEWTRKWLKELQSVPLDPLLKSPYTYSVTTNKKEYQLWYALEWSVAYNNSSLLSKTYANTSNLLWYTDGDYNWVVLKVSTWSIDYYLAVPSIISADISKARLIDLTWSLVFSWKKNIPWNTALLWLWSKSTDPSVLFNPKNTWDFVIYSTWAWNIPDTEVFINNLKNIYTWSVLENVWDQKLTNKIIELNESNIWSALKNTWIVNTQTQPSGNDWTNNNNSSWWNNNPDNNNWWWDDYPENGFLWIEQRADNMNSPLWYTVWDHWWPHSYSPINCDAEHIWWQYWVWAWMCNWPIDWTMCRDDIWNIDDSKRTVKNNDSWEFLSWTDQNKQVYYLYTCVELTWDDVTPPAWWDFTINNWATIANSKDVVLDITIPKDDRTITSNLKIAYWEEPNPTNWTNITKSVIYELSSWEWNKTIYMRFKDRTWNISSQITKSITFSNSCTYDVIKINSYEPNGNITINKACWPIILNLVSYNTWTTNIVNNSWKNILKINYTTYEGNINYNVVPTNGIERIDINENWSALSSCPNWWNWWSPWTYWICDTAFNNLFNSHSLNQNWNRIWLQLSWNVTIE